MSNALPPYDLRAYCIMGIGMRNELGDGRLKEMIKERLPFTNIWIHIHRLSCKHAFIFENFLHTQLGNTHTTHTLTNYDFTPLEEVVRMRRSVRAHSWQKFSQACLAEEE